MKIQESQFALDGREYIELKNLMKLASLVNSGGEVKMYCQNGEISVNGELETRRGKKLRVGDTLLFGIKQIEKIEGVIMLSCEYFRCCYVVSDFVKKMAGLVKNMHCIFLINKNFNTFAI